MTKDEITFDEFQKLDLKVAEITSAEEIEGKDKLLKIEIDLGGSTRNLVAGIKGSYNPEDLIGKKIVVVANLEPRRMAGTISEGMLLAASDGGDVSLLTPDRNVANGSSVG